MQRVEHDHARGDWHFVLNQIALVAIAAKDFEGCVHSQLSVVSGQLSVVRLVLGLRLGFLAFGLWSSMFDVWSLICGLPATDFGLDNYALPILNSQDLRPKAKTNN
jgi:hypothetical protein